MKNEKEKSYTNIEAVDILHKVANIYTSTKIPHDYGTGEEYTSVEVHTLKDITDNPGITVTELARDYGKTKGAVSQILKKIESKGLIYRQVDEDNDNRFHLFPTEKGIQLDDAHRQYDQIKFGESMNIVRRNFKEEQINTAFEVLETWLQVRRSVQQERMMKMKEEKRNQKK